MTYNVTIFGIHLKLNPIAFTLPIGKNGWDIYWYGIIIATGFLLAIIYAYKNAKRFDINLDRMLDVILVTTPVAILCARAYYLIFDGEKLSGIGEFFGVGSPNGFTGLAIYGGVIGAFGCGLLMCKLRKINVLDMFDLASIGFLIGQGIGRWGNFMNQEAFGGPTGSSFFGMTSENVVKDFAEKGYDPTALAHPCFLYESIWCIAGFFVLNYFSKKRKFSGEIILIYCVWYGFGRGFIELLRTDSLMIGPFKVSCLLSFAICIAAAAVLVLMRKKEKSEVADKTYESVFSADNAESDAKDTENITEDLTETETKKTTEKDDLNDENS